MYDGVVRSWPEVSIPPSVDGVLNPPLKLLDSYKKSHVTIDDHEISIYVCGITPYDAINTPNPTIGQKFLTFTRDEVQSYFDDSFNELEHLAAFDLISAIEGNLRADFYLRIHTKDKSNLGREFRNKYRTLDVLIIDDIQGISGKEGIEGEFFNIFNDLQRENKQITLFFCNHRLRCYSGHK